VERILILGPCGAGKSTLARKMAQIHDLPVIHLDQHHWRSGWEEPAPEEWKEQVEQLIAQPRWIMDGNYGSSLVRRLERAQLVINLDYPRRVFFPRILWRSLSQYGRTRADLAPNCPERIDLEFWRYAWRYRIDTHPRREAQLTASKVPVLRFRSPRQAKEWLEAGAPLSTTANSA
jgi:adenylate kinase family enzyme